MSQFIRQRLHILEERDKPLFYIFSNLSSFLFIWCGNLVEGRFKIWVACVFRCSTFAYSVRFVLLVDCLCWLRYWYKNWYKNLVIRQSVSQSIHFKQQMTASQLFLSDVIRRTNGQVWTCVGIIFFSEKQLDIKTIISYLLLHRFYFAWRDYTHLSLCLFNDVQ